MVLKTLLMVFFNLSFCNFYKKDCKVPFYYCYLFYIGILSSVDHAELDEF